MVTINKMEEKHLDMVFEIEKYCFVTPWSYESLKKEIYENKLAVYLVALDGDIVVGYAGMWHVVNEGHITNIAVKEGYRRMGIATKIMEQFISFAQSREMMGLTLEVRISNTAAQRMYSKLGFKPEGFRKRYYADTNEDAVIMWKYL
ncbi:MAG: ribosomal protein S18-alanine N-acetyltransferase [Clostridiales bacterium]|jgi:ribosomal-protein-alanine N-acetyltransferase|nr:ribosomal protein S18-alanine N-acetyltransferase [Clostridiales bacterium]